MNKLLIAALLLSFSAAAFAQQEYVGRYDAFAGFSYLDSPKLNLEQRGFNTQVGVNVTRWLALGFDYSTQQGKGTLLPTELKPSLQELLAAFPLPPGYTLYVPFSATTQTFTGGPQLSCRHFKRATFFIHPSIGAIHEHINLEPHDPISTGIVGGLLQAGVLQTTAPSDTTYFYGLGGGAEFNASKHVHLRADVEYVHVFLFSGLLADSRNSVRLSIGPTFNFGKNVAR
jgi:opacity protein-like surface antigen